ncbi:hypothetical protein ABVT39_027569 [Epinephelus coioides]
MEKLQQTLNALVESNQALTVKMDKIDTLSSKLDRLMVSVESIGNRLEKTEAELYEHASKLDKHELRIQTLEKDLQEALTEIDRLENRSRRHNLRLLNLLEKSEAGNSMVSFLANFLTDLLSIPIQAHNIEMAHRIGPPPQSNKCQAVIFKLFHFQKKLDILEAAKSQELKYQDQPVRITTDMSARWRWLRGEFWPLRQQLHDKGIQTRVRDPATL